AADTWKDTRIQRCLVHVLRNTRTDPTCRPRTDAGKDLPRLARKPVKVRDADAAAAWLNLPDDWHTRYADIIGQRTTARDDPGNPKARAGRTWWWTHARLRRAYYRFIRLQRDGTLFACCEPAPAGSVPSTTNRLEGGVNADIKRVLDAHRGLTEEPMKRCEWVLYMKTHNPDPGSFITAAHDETTEPPTTGTGLPAGGIQEAAPGVDAYESGFGIRKGRAGKTR
ncbi:IS3509a transposase, partial [Bifidobacterium subtile]